MRRDFRISNKDCRSFRIDQHSWDSTNKDPSQVEDGVFLLYFSHGNTSLPRHAFDLPLEKYPGRRH